MLPIPDASPAPPSLTLPLTLTLELLVNTFLFVTDNISFAKHCGCLLFTLRPAHPQDPA